MPKQGLIDVKGSYEFCKNAFCVGLGRGQASHICPAQRGAAWEHPHLISDRAGCESFDAEALRAFFEYRERREQRTFARGFGGWLPEGTESHWGALNLREEGAWDGQRNKDTSGGPGRTGPLTEVSL